jgi:hypothetical protein
MVGSLAGKEHPAAASVTAHLGTTPASPPDDDAASPRAVSTRGPIVLISAVLALTIAYAAGWHSPDASIAVGIVLLLALAILLDLR